MRILVALMLAGVFFGASLVANAASRRSEVSFRREVQPIFAHRCFKCHAGEDADGDLDLKSRKSVFSREAPVVVPGSSGNSLLLERVTSTKKHERMPPEGAPLSEREVSLLRRWIDEGARWEEADEAAINRKPAIRLDPPKLPEGAEHPIDRLLAGYFVENQVDPPRALEDRLFARRVFLDIVGLLPTPEQFRAYVDDRDPLKPIRLVERLLADNEGYAEHWMPFWQDHLRDGLRGMDETGNPLCASHFHVRPITEWLYQSLVQNKAYDQFVRELVNPPDLPVDPYDDTPAFRKLPQNSSGLLQGVRIGGAAPAPVDTSEMQAAQNIAQVFLGIQLKCATCHDSFVDGWKQHEAWGLASVFARQPLEMHKAEAPTGRHALPAFLFPELNLVDPAASQRDRMEQLARGLTSSKNGLFARTIVNRIWARLMGRGLVEPLDDMSEPAWHPGLLDWLAADLIEHGYDLKHLLHRILTSAAYRLPAVEYDAAASSRFVFRGPLIRRMTSEQFLDALYAFQGRPCRAWRQQPNALTDALGRPDRQIVATARENDPTVLQALQFLNGSALQELLNCHESSGQDRKIVNGRCPVTRQRLDREEIEHVEILLYERVPIGFADRQSLEAFRREPAKYLPAFDRQLQREKIIRNPPEPIARDADLFAMARRRFEHGLSRAPASEELEIMQAVFGANPTLNDLADVTWLILMNPEFQLIR